MMPRSRRRRPQAEGLETRELLAAPARHALVSIAGRPASGNLAIRGVVRLVDTVHPSSGDFGPTHSLVGQGRLPGLGPVHASAGIQSPGFIRDGHAQGYMTLATRRGTVTLFLQSDQPQAGPTLPTTFNYVVTGGTGGLVGAVGKGTAVLSSSNRGLRMNFRPLAGV